MAAPVFKDCQYKNPGGVPLRMNPDVPGFRAQNTPIDADVPCCEPPQVRNYVEEDILWALQTVFHPLVSGIGSNVLESGSITVRGVSYTAGSNVMGDGDVSPILIANIPSDLSGYLVKARMYFNINNITTSFKVHIFDGDPGIAFSDAQPFAVTIDSIEKYIGFVQFPAMGNNNGNSDISYAIVDDLRLPIIKANQGGASGNVLYCVVESDASCEIGDSTICTIQFSIDGR